MGVTWPVEREPRSLTQMFEADPARVERLSLEAAGLYFDWSKTHLTEELIGQFAGLVDERGLSAARDALFGGKIVNTSENRPAEHTAERGEGAPESVARARVFHN